MDDREIYPSAPLRFVAFELRYPAVPEFATQEGTLPVYAALRETFPIIGPSPAATIEINLGQRPQGRRVAVPPGAGPQGPLRLIDRQRRLSAVVGPRAVVVENTAYHRYEQFIEVVGQVIQAVRAVATIEGIERVGLRYIDDIRVPGVSEPRDWHGYISPALLAAVDLHPEYTVAKMQSVAEYRVSSQQAATLRFGAGTGRVINSSGALRVDPADDGPFFLIDIDSFWRAPEEELPRFSPEAVMEICDSLRQPVRALFESAITDKLRNEVLRQPPVQHKEGHEQHPAIA
jgi:uncharacterized protein (TIGR04255 family)